MVLACTVRCESLNGSVTVRLISSKSRVAPRKTFPEKIRSNRSHGWSYLRLYFWAISTRNSGIASTFQPMPTSGRLFGKCSLLTGCQKSRLSPSRKSGISSLVPTIQQTSYPTGWHLHSWHISLCGFKVHCGYAKIAQLGPSQLLFNQSWANHCSKKSQQYRTPLKESHLVPYFCSDHHFQ